MKRGVLILFALVMCAVMTGCTLYFGGWATSSGLVKQATDDVPLPGASVTYTSVSDPEYVVHAVTDSGGRWQTEWLKLDRYTVEFSHPDCSSVVMTRDIRDRDTDVSLGVIYLAAKESDETGE